MESLWNFLRAGDYTWLTVPRFAIVTWSGTSGTALLAVAPRFAAPVLLLGLAGIARLLWFRLLPHETARLESAKAELAAARPNEPICYALVLWRLGQVARAEIVTTDNVSSSIASAAHAID